MLVPIFQLKVKKNVQCGDLILYASIYIILLVYLYGPTDNAKFYSLANIATTIWRTEC